MDVNNNLKPNKNSYILDGIFNLLFFSQIIALTCFPIIKIIIDNSESTFFLTNPGIFVITFLSLTTFFGIVGIISPGILILGIFLLIFKKKHQISKTKLAVSLLLSVLLLVIMFWDKMNLDNLILWS